MGSSAPDRPVTPCSLVAVPAWRSIPRRQRENLRVLDSRAHDDDALRASRVDVQDRLQERVIREGRVRVQMHDPASDRHVRDAPVARHADRHFGHGQSSKTSVVHCSSPPVTSTPGYPGGTWISNSYSAPDVGTARPWNASGMANWMFATIVPGEAVMDERPSTVTSWTPALMPFPTNRMWKIEPTLVAVHVETLNPPPR